MLILLILSRQHVHPPKVVARSLHGHARGLQDHHHGHPEHDGHAHAGGGHRGRVGGPRRFIRRRG